MVGWCFVLRVPTSYLHGLSPSHPPDLQNPPTNHHHHNQKTTAKQNTQQDALAASNVAAGTSLSLIRVVRTHVGEGVELAKYDDELRRTVRCFCGGGRGVGGGRSHVGTPGHYSSPPTGPSIGNNTKQNNPPPPKHPKQKPKNRWTRWPPATSGTALSASSTAWPRRPCSAGSWRSVRIVCFVCVELDGAERGRQVEAGSQSSPHVYVHSRPKTLTRSSPLQPPQGTT